MKKQLKVAIVADWLTNMGGAEPVTLRLQSLFPGSPIYTSVYTPEKMPLFSRLDVRTTWMQKVLPAKLRNKHVLWPVLRAYAFPTLDLSEYDVIISSSSAEAKAVRKTRAGQVHIAYVHTPIRYYWSHYDEFRREFNFGPLTWIIRPFIPMFVRLMRPKDLASVKGVDIFIANSEVTRERIKKYYGREAFVVHPPVEIDRFTPPPRADRDGYVVWGRHVPYKRFDLAIQACNKLGRKLTVIGSGPDTERLKKLAGPTISFPGRVSDEELVSIAQHSKAFLFANEEDFGISPVEAIAAGTPVIAYARGGALDYVVDGETGVLFQEQSVDSLAEAIERFETMKFSPATLHRRSKRFAPSLFDTKIRKIVADATRQ